MSPVHSSSATPAASDTNAKLNALHPRFRNLGLELRNGLALFQSASASRTAGRQRYFDNFINRGGEGPAIAAPLMLSCLSSGVFGPGFGVLPRTGGRLAPCGSLRPFPTLPRCVSLFSLYVARC